MKNMFLVVLLAFGVLSSFAQKTTIDASVYNKWSTVSDATLSNNGLFASYTIDNTPAGSKTVIIKQRNGSWEKRVAGGLYSEFLNDGQWAVVTKNNDSLLLVKLNTNEEVHFEGIVSYRFLKRKNKKFLLLNKVNEKGSELFLYNLNSGVSNLLSSIGSYLMSGNHEIVFFTKDSVVNNMSIKLLNRFNINDQSMITLWTGKENPSTVQSDYGGSQIAFMITDTSKGEFNKTCLYWREGNVKCKILFDNQTTGIQKGMKISSLDHFSKDGSRLFFTIGREEEKMFPVGLADYSSVYVWSYLDKKLQPLQLKRYNEKNSYLCVYDINNHDVFRLEYDGDMFSTTFFEDKTVIIHYDPDADTNERNWNKDNSWHTYLISARNKSRTLLDRIGPNRFSYLSPDEKFVMFSDSRNFFSYEISSGIYRNLTEGIVANWFKYNNTRGKLGVMRGFAAWLKHDEAVLVYDRYDIWLLDPTGKKSSRNITNGYGLKHNVFFSLGLNVFSSGPISKDDILILTAMDSTTKQSGFFSKNLEKNGDPECLTLGSYVYSMLGSHYPKATIEKSSNNKGYIVSRMSATQSLNYFLTNDFKEFTPLSKVYPEQKVNWYTTELHTWQSLNGKNLQGILYKPENFDSTKKYPVIFNYYETKSQDLNICLKPGNTGSDINIPTYVSNGYLVFAPDIEYNLGDPMRGTYNSVVSAARYLSQLSFVDSTKLGIQGFSFGGIQTNYLVANTNLFAAACAGGAMSDLVSAYGTVAVSGTSLQGFFEFGGQFRMDSPPWDLTDMYIRNSPVFKANKVNTPLLLMHGTKDDASPFSQGVEFFTALRRLGKRVWLLEYTDAGHGLLGRDATDFTIRMRQFFDHYLMNKPAPVWMNKGIPAKMRGLENGLELDSVRRISNLN